MFENISKNQRRIPGGGAKQKKLGLCAVLVRKFNIKTLRSVSQRGVRLCAVLVNESDSAQC